MRKPLTLLTIALLGLLGLLTMVGSNSANPHWDIELFPNEPDPFCPETDSTTIRFQTAMENADGRLVVYRDGEDGPVRVLLDGAITPGDHEVLWDGRDESGEILADGLYPYVLTIVDGADSSIVFFSDTLVAEIDCASPTQKTTWGSLRGLFSDDR